MGRLVVNVVAMSVDERLREVIVKAAPLLPGEVGQRLLSLISPKSLAVMAGVLVIWAGAHFFGVGEIADVILLVTGVVAIGASALEGGRKLLDFGIGTVRAKTEVDLDRAARDLAAAIAILGIDTVLALLFKGRPHDTFVESYKGPLPPFSQAAARLPVSGPIRMLEARLIFTKAKLVGRGGTDGYNVARIGRDFYSGARPVGELMQDVRRAVYHERVHQRINQAFSLFGKPGQYIHLGAYKRSYIIRYIEEAAADVYGRMRVEFGHDALLEGVRFPFNDGYYGVTLVKMGHEAKGVLLGPVTVGGTLFQAYYGLIEDDRGK